MIIESQYDINQVVFWLEKTYDPIKHMCPVCLGESKLFRFDKTKVKCPRCNGNKEVDAGHKIIYQTVVGNINSIRIDVGTKTYINYKVQPTEGMREIEISEDCLYGDIVDAGIECGKRNKNNDT